jgi:hypothetical protein
MRIKVIRKFRLLLLVLSFAFLCLGVVQAQSLRFAQITDPHLFDLGEEGTKNKAALAACIKALNNRMDENADYKFAVITGDIGVENLVSHVVDTKTKQRIREDAATEERQLNEGAAALATILAPTKIHLWFFVPGNNDLYLEKPELNDYKQFLEKLREKLPGLEIRDLCAAEGSENAYSIGGLQLIGFNNASFKNNNDVCRLWQNKTLQRGYVEQVIKHLKPNDAPALIFYHIPEVDDPHIVLNADTETPNKRTTPCDDPSGFPDRKDLKAWTESDGGPYPDSSWFVYPDVLKVWKKNVVNNEKVLGLFAGHLHDWRRENYSGSLSKLYICPPLAIKLQDKKPLQARGFQEVAVDGAGKIDRTIFWLDADGTFDTDPWSKTNELALALFYETSHEWQQAENHFAEAAKSAPSNAIRNQSLAGLTRVKAARRSWVGEILGWTEPLVSLGISVLRILVAGGILLVIFIVAFAVWEGWSALVIHPFDGDDELAKALALGFPAVRAKVTKLLNSPNQAFLPLNVHTAFTFVAPRLNQLLPVEAFEVAGVKVPNLNIVLNWIVRPRFQVNGGFVPSAQTTFVYAEVWRRRRNWFGLYLQTVVTRNIPNGQGRAREVENLIYEIYLTANDSNSVQNTRA